MDRIKKTITLRKDAIEWAEYQIEEGVYPGVRSLSGLIEYLLSSEMRRQKGERINE